jgi:hypothetical protein
MNGEGDDYEYQSILPVVRDYKMLWEETKQIQQEIKNFRDRFANRLKELKKQQDGLEKLILEFMDKNQHPGIRDQDTTIMSKAVRSKQSIKARKEKIETILSSNRIDTEIKKKIYDALDNDEEGNEVMRLQISVARKKK